LLARLNDTALLSLSLAVLVATFLFRNHVSLIYYTIPSSSRFFFFFLGLRKSFRLAVHPPCYTCTFDGSISVACCSCIMYHWTSIACFSRTLFSYRQGIGRDIALELFTWNGLWILGTL
jgi:hypothetical protein